MAEPRFIRDQQGTVYDLAGGFLDPLSSPDEFTSRSGSTDIVGGSTLVSNPQEYLTGVFRKQAENRFLPQQQLALQGVEQGLAGLSQEETNVGRQFDRLGEALLESAKASRGQLTEDQNRYGLLSSGLTASGLGKIEENLGRGQKETAQDRAASLARLALERAGLLTRQADIKQQTSQNINDLVSQLLSNSTQAQQAEFNRRLQLEAVADSLPVGRSIKVMGTTIQGRKQPQVSTLDLGGEIAFIDEAGNILKRVGKSLAPSAGSGGGGGSLSTASGKNNALIQAVQAAIASGEYTASGEKGKKSREQLIGELSAVFAGSGINAQDIKDAVYGSFRGANEKPYVPKSGSTKPPTAEQSKTAQFASRLFEANQIFDSLAPQVTGAFTNKFSLTRNTPERLQSSEVKQQIQAERNFINAILRRESGAAIAQSEFDNAAKQYFPQPGDSQKVLEQKRKNRLNVMNSLINEAGSAYRAPLSSFER